MSQPILDRRFAVPQTLTLIFSVAWFSLIAGVDFATAHVGHHGTLDDHVESEVSTAAVASYDAYHVGIDFFDTTVYPMCQFFPCPDPPNPLFQNGMAPFPLTTPGNYFVSQGGLAGWTEDQARRAVTLAVDDMFRDIDVGDPHQRVALNVYHGSASTSLEGQRLNVALGKSSPQIINLLGTAVGGYNDPTRTDDYVVAAFLENIDGLGDGHLVYDTPEGVVNSIAGVVGHELGHVFAEYSPHIILNGSEPAPLPLITAEQEGLPTTARLTERRFSTTLPTPGDSIAARIIQRVGTTSRGDLDLNGFADAGDFNTMSVNWGTTDALYHEGDITGDELIDAGDFTALSLAWTGDPGPAGAGMGLAEYDPTTGEIVVSFAGVNNWFIESLSGSLTGAAATLPGTGLATDNNNKIGESNIFLMPDQTDWNLGAVAALGLGAGDLFLTTTAGLGEPAIVIPVTIIPEPTSLVLAALGLCGVMATRRRRAA